MMPATSAALRIEKISLSLGSTPVLRELDFEAPEGKLTAVLGPSGSGKTTLLRALAGLEQPDRGKVLAGGRVLSCSDDGAFVPARERGMGMVFQSYALWPHLTVFENAAFPLRLRKLPEEELARRVKEALALVRMEGLADRRPEQLSGGQQQRAALARAIVYRPAFLLLDEPLANLDARVREEVRAEILALHRRLRTTTVYVTHDQSEALAIADSVALLQEGRVVQQGSPREVYNRPASRFAAEFLGACNAVAGSSLGTREGEGCWFEFDRARGPVGPHASSIPKGQAVCACLRPEDLEPCSDAATWQGTVLRTDFLGDAALCDADCAGLRLRVRLDADSAPEPGESLGLRVRPGRLKIYPGKRGVS